MKASWLTLSVIAFIGIVLELIVSINRVTSDFDSAFIRGINLFVYFTIWSNLLIAYAGYRLSRNSTIKSSLFWGLYIAGLGGTALTFAIHRLFLAGPLTGLPLFSDTILHINLCYVRISADFKVNGYIRSTVIR